MARTLLPCSNDADPPELPGRPVGLDLWSKDMMIGAKITLAEWWLWNQIPVTLGNLVGGFVFTGLALYVTHIPRLAGPAPLRVPAQVPAG
jgi:hypothetical protein